MSAFRRELEQWLDWCAKTLKVQGNKTWNEMGLNRAGKALEEAAQAYAKGKDAILSCHEQLSWLQERFPDGAYQDVTGLCKVADQEEIVEQDYSLNPGRYVGVVIEEDNLSEEEFAEKIRKNI